jgi:hypothetical protein
MHRLHHLDTPASNFDLDMTDLIETLIDHGLTRGLLALQYTHGVSINTQAKYDVAAVAAIRLLDTLPGHVSVAEVLDGLRRRSIALSPEVQ